VPVRAGVYPRAVTLFSVSAVSRSRPFDLFAYCLSVCGLQRRRSTVSFQPRLRPSGEWHLSAWYSRTAACDHSASVHVMARLSSFFPSRREHRFNLVERRTLAIVIRFGWWAAFPLRLFIGRLILLLASRRTFDAPRPPCFPLSVMNARRPGNELHCRSAWWVV